MTVRELIRQSEAMLDETNKDCNVAKVLFYHLANKEPHQLYLMMDEEVDELSLIHISYNKSPTKVHWTISSFGFCGFSSWLWHPLKNNKAQRHNCIFFIFITYSIVGDNKSFGNLFKKWKWLSTYENMIQILQLFFIIKKKIKEE